MKFIPVCTKFDIYVFILSGTLKGEIFGSQIIQKPLGASDPKGERQDSQN
jgi:hypothetical protein